VLLGIMLKEAALPPLQSLLEGPSTVFRVAETQKDQYYKSNPYHTKKRPKQQ
jgi:hypothetical protein